MGISHERKHEMSVSTYSAKQNGYDKKKARIQKKFKTMSEVKIIKNNDVIYVSKSNLLN